MPETRKELLRLRTERIIAQYKSGASLEAVGEAFDISGERVRQILKRAGCPRRPMTVTEKFLKSRRKPVKLIAKETLERLYTKENLSLRRIHRQLKTSTGIIYRSLDFHGIKRRSAEEDRRLLSKRPELDRAALHKLYVEDDLSAGEIAGTFDYAAGTVKSKLSRMGIRKLIQSKLKKTSLNRVKTTKTNGGLEATEQENKKEGK